MKGMWTLCLTENNEKYYYNAYQNKSVWNVPSNEKTNIHVAPNLTVPSNSNSNDYNYVNNNDNNNNITNAVLEEGELQQNYEMYQQQQQQQQQQYEIYQQQQQQYYELYQQQYYEMYQQQQLQQYSNMTSDQSITVPNQYSNITSESINDMLDAAAAAASAQKRK